MIYVLFLIIWLSVNIIMTLLHKSEKRFLIVNGIILVAIASLRGIHIGRDVEAYSRIFFENGKLSYWEILTKVSDGMVGYRLLAKTVYLLTGGNYQFMLLMSSAITVYGVFKFAYHYSPNAVSTVFYFVTTCYYFESFNIVRQWISISLVLLGIIAFDERKYYKLVVLVLLAVSVHNGVAIMLIPFFSFRIIKWNKVRFGAFAAVAIVSMSAIPYLIRLFISMFPRYIPYVFVLEQGYAGQGFGGVARGRRAILSVAFLLVMLTAVLLLKEGTLSMKTSYQNKPWIKNYFWPFAAMVMIEAIIGITFYNNVFYIRIQTFFSFFTIFMMPTVIERIRKKWRFLAYLGTNMVFLLSTVIKMFPTSDVAPYQFFWQ